MWLNDYYCSVFDVLSPACGFSVALSAIVLIAMYRDIANSVTVRVSGMLGLSDAMYQISQLVVRELALQPKYQSFSAAARVFAFTTYFFPLLNTLLVSRIALDLETNFLRWFTLSRSLRWLLRHYVKVSIALAFVCACPLFFARAHFDPNFLYPQWSFGTTTRDTCYMVFGFYLLILLQVINFALVIIVVIMRLRIELPSENNPPNSLSTHIMRTLEQRMRRKARILILYPLSPIIFYSPTLVFSWVQVLHLEQNNVTTAIWITSLVVGPIQSLFDLLVFLLLPPVQRVIRWYWTLHKDSDMLPLVERGRRESIFVGYHGNGVALTTEEAWVQDVTDPRSPATH
ncbi:hypothetical protein GGI25_005307 [Coemansia spiralis]|uniref:G protein-coupled receptor GPR1/2/3 C-terminal domain-containing protein n=2 Tax=Coemansia TaxID=4863 RepID=A0A9W8KUS4_9FUNG|nr:hypothetical protein EDC05_004108 [Coemansia umbellata]KAJ2620737.1 hypothetical protein GGI26_004725 [Coemansia sp. RSA 1358]KAJ2671918.1 hypothetical protein GGI25_005307 [Coemansia spiralis]